MNCTRRQFLHSLAAAAPAASLWGAVAAAGAHDVGFSLYGMKDLPLTDALRECAAIGYRNVELCLLPEYATAPAAISAGGRKVLREQLEAQRLSVSGALIQISLSSPTKSIAPDLETIRAGAQLLRDVAPSVAPLLETVLGGKPAEWEVSKGGMRERLALWADAARRADALIAIKAHVGSAVNSPERLRWLIESVASPHIVAAYDYSHFSLHGLTLEASLAVLLPYTKFIHVKDAAGDATKPRFLLPGEGAIDYVAYFRALTRAKYRGPIVVEVSSQLFRQPGYNPVEAARHSFVALSRAAAVAATTPQ
jgi:sugar phosphate isomerase/epimerase